MFVTAANISTHYQRIGKGPLVVLLHGWGCDWQIWSPIIPELSESYCLIIPDLPVFGSSAQPSTAWKSPEYATWLHEFLAATVGNEPCVVVGHSFGGKTAINWATQYPTMATRSLVLVDSAGLPDPLSWPRHLQKRVLGFIPHRLKNRIPARWRSKALQALRTSTDHFYSNPEQKAILEQTVGESVAPFAPQVKLSTLILWGKNDPDTPIHQGESLAKLIPGATLHVFENSGHFPFIDETANFLNVFKQHLQKVLA